MSHKGSIFKNAAVLVLLGATAAAASTAPASGRAVAVRPVIGKAMMMPAKPLSGKRATVAFKVTRSDTRAPLMYGRMMCDPSVTGKVIPHSESFRAGTARLSFVVPVDAAGKLLTVKLTIKAGGQSAKTVASFRVLQGVKPSLSASDASVTEGNAGTTTLSIPVALSFASSQPVSVTYATSDGSAIAPGDYAAASGRLSFAPGETSKTLTVTVVGDTAVEQDETFTIAFSNPVNATIADPSVTGTIKNEDVAPRGGHYQGTTSQGRSIAFDVESNLGSFGNFVVYVDINCTEVPISLPNREFNPSGVSFSIQPDWTFGFSTSYNEPDGSGSSNFTFHGALSLPGNASGTLRIDFTLNNIEGIGTVHCSTGDVTWTASAA